MIQDTGPDGDDPERSGVEEPVAEAEPPAPAVRHLVAIEDVSIEEMHALFRLADRFASDPRAFADTCPGFISASLFYEPSTRTRLSFESAMLRLGGGVLTAAEMTSSSVVKGESLADTIRVVGGGYADAIVLRHPSEGAARLAARYSPVPVINAGDGSLEHPTQTLCDLYTLWKEKGRLEGLEVVLCGDLRYSRTIHSFCYALARFGANIVTMPYPGFELPDYVLQRLRRDYGVQAATASVADLPGLAASSNAAAYLTASKPHQLALFTKLGNVEVSRIDAIYMTRAQRERPRRGCSRSASSTTRSLLRPRRSRRWASRSRSPARTCLARCRWTTRPWRRWAQTVGSAPSQRTVGLAPRSPWTAAPRRRSTS